MVSDSVPSTKDAFKRAALYQSCKRSRILSNIDYERMNEGELVELVNHHNSHSIRELPIIAAKALTKGFLTFINDRFPKTRNYLIAENIKVTIEDDELAYLINTPSRGSSSLVMIVAKNIAFGAIGTSIERLKNDIMRDHDSRDVDASESKLIRVTSTDDGASRINIRSKSPTPVYDSFGVNNSLSTASSSSGSGNSNDNDVEDVNANEIPSIIESRNKRALDDSGNEDNVYIGSKRIRLIDDHTNIIEQRIEFDERDNNETRANDKDTESVVGDNSDVHIDDKNTELVERNTDYESYVNSKRVKLGNDDRASRHDERRSFEGNDDKDDDVSVMENDAQRIDDSTNFTDNYNISAVDNVNATPTVIVNERTRVLEPPLSVERKRNAVDFIDLITSELPSNYRHASAREFHGRKTHGKDGYYVDVDDDAKDAMAEEEDSDDFDY